MGNPAAMHMSDDIRRSLRPWIALLLVATLWPIGDAGGAEPAWEFLARLRQRGYQDAALGYLERMGSDPQCPADLKDALDYQLGVMLADGLSRSDSPVVQAAQLQKARARLEKFLAEHPRQHALAFEARWRLARVLAGLGKLEAEMAAAIEESSPDRGRWLGRARGSFQAAQQTLETMEKQLQDELSRYPPHLDEKDPRYPRRQDIDRQLMELPLEIGSLIEARAKTYQPVDKEHRQLLTAAADRYHRLYAKHPAFYGGIYARMCEGRVLQELGRASEAVEAFEDIWSQVNDGEQVRLIRDQTLILMLKTYSLPLVKRYQQALALAADWQKTADLGEQSSPEGLEAHYLAGVAALNHAGALAEKSAARREASLVAKSHFDFVAAHCGELQGQAWERSAELAVVLAVVPPEGKRGPSPFVRSTVPAVPANGDGSLFPDGKPASFALNKAAGDAAWDRMTAWRVKSQEAKTRQNQEQYASQADQAARQAIGFYRQALAKWPLAVPALDRHSPPSDSVGNALRGVPGTEEKHVPPLAAHSDTILKPTSPSDCQNLVRYRLAYLLLAAGEYDDAGLLGEFLAQHYPEAAEARKAAEISVEAYRNVVVQRLQAASAAGDGAPLSTGAIRRATALATERLVRVGRFLVGRWPAEVEAVEAARRLIDTAVDRRDATLAEEFLAGVPAVSSYRPQAELRVGQAWWETYVEAAPAVDADRLPPEELHKLAERAQAMLQKGIEHTQAGHRPVGPPEYALVYSAFALAQMAMDQGQAAESVRWLEDPAIGPMRLLSSGGRASGDLLAMADQTLLLAVLSYASARLPDKALDTLVRLENRALGRGDPLAGRQLARQYHVAGIRLGKVLLRLKQEGKADEAQQIAIGQDLLLDRIAQRTALSLPPGEGRGEGTLGSVSRPGNTLGETSRPGASSFAMRVWIAETCLALGDDGQHVPKSSEAAAYLRRAVRTWLAMLDRLQAAPSWGPPEAASDIQVRLAAALRAQGQYPPALDRLAAVLGQENSRMDAQIEAARTWQAWAQDDPGCYLQAIRGDNYPWRLPGGAVRQVPLWGWEEIARRLAPFERYGEQLLDARYNLAVCHAKWAATQTKPSREASLGKAADEVAAVGGRLPSAGTVWAARFESLLKEIDDARKVKVSGK